MGHHLQTILPASTSKLSYFGDYLLTMAVLKLTDSSLNYQVVKEISENPFGIRLGGLIGVL